MVKKAKCRVSAEMFDGSVHVISEGDNLGEKLACVLYILKHFENNNGLTVRASLDLLSDLYDLEEADEQQG